MDQSASRTRRNHGPPIHQEKYEHLPALRLVIQNLPPTTTSIPTLGDYTSPAVSGYYRLGLPGPRHHRRDTIILEIDQYENEDLKEQDHLASVSGWLYLQDKTKPHEDIYYVEEYHTFSKSNIRYFIPVDVTTPWGPHNHLDPDTDLATHGSVFHTTHRHTQLKLNRISRASQLLEDDWASRRRPWTTPQPTTKQHISPFGADAYEDPAKVRPRVESRHSACPHPNQRKPQISRTTP
jgi:hypothetical protein